MCEFPEKVQLMIFKTVSRELPAIELEDWVFECEALPDLLIEADYLELVSLRFQGPRAIVKAGEIFEKYIDWGEYETWHLRVLLNRILNRDDDLAEVLREFTVLQEKYSFLQKLGKLGNWIVNPEFCDQSWDWDDLSLNDQRKIVDALWPDAIREALKILKWLDERHLILVAVDGQTGRGEYIDNRSAGVRRRS